jgi:hypothetical protein
LFVKKGRGSHLLELEFEPAIDEPSFYVSPRTGKDTTSWLWKHTSTKKEVRRFPTANGKGWDTGVLSTALQRLNPRTERVSFLRGQLVLRLNSKHGQAHTEVVTAVPVDEEKQLTQWVRCVLFAVDANCATAALRGMTATRFFQSLDPLHTPPHRLAFMRLVRLLEQAVFREYKRIVSDNFLLYGTNFASTNSDFYTNRERREKFGALVSNMLATTYSFEVSR